MAEAKEAKSDLRKAHFNFGSEKGGSEAFMTTNMERFKKSEVAERNVIVDTRDRKVVNIVYGN